MTEQDPYCYPSTDTLRNKAGIRDPAALSTYEYQKTAARSLQLRLNPIAGKYDLAHLRAIHQYLFQDVYDWAGDLRTVTISKGTSTFALPGMIEDYGNSTVFKGIAKDKYLANMDKDKFTARLAHHYSEVNALHPFREGNGRSTRVFIDDLARHAGYQLDFSTVDEKTWNDAARQSFSGSLQPMQDVFSTAARPIKAITFERESKAEALRQHPDLIAAYATLDAAHAVANSKFPDTAAHNIFVASIRASIQATLNQNKPLPGNLLKDHQHGSHQPHIAPPANDIER